MKQTLALFGAVLAAVAASACCILPALLGVAGLGTLGLGAALEPFRPTLVGLTALLLAAAFYFSYRPSRAACDASGNCDSGGTRGLKHFNRAALWCGAAATVAALAYSQLAESRVAATQPAPAAAASQTPSKEIVFTIGNMTCASCTTGIADALRKVPGVQEAQVVFATRNARVRYDPRLVGVPQLRTAIQKSGFPVEASRG